VPGVAVLPIRTFGDPVLRQPTREIEVVDESIFRLVEDMIETMHAAPGVGLAAPQVGVQKRLFVYDIGDGPHAVLNPEISDYRGEWTYDEGCLSVPKMFWPIVRPQHVRLRGRDLDGRDISVEADELLSRVFQHEVDHLDGMLLLQRLDTEQRKSAMRTLRERTMSTPSDGPGGPAVTSGR
jgi:peptide deformylase